MDTVVHDLAKARSRGEKIAEGPTASHDSRVPGRYTGTSYYGRQVVKPSPFEWHIGAYLIVSSVAGATQIIAALAERFGARGMRSVARNGRYIAFAGSIAGPLLLIGDLKTPHRWYNMLRIFRRTSAMSIGTYVLTSFGAFSAITALAEALSGSRRHTTVARVVELPAAAAGAGMLTYTGALLSSTSTPLWAAESPLLSGRFAASGIAAGAAVLSIAEQVAARVLNARALDRLALTATGTYAALSLTSARQVQRAGVNAPLTSAPYGSMYRAGAVLSVAVPLVCHGLNILSGHRSRALSTLASLSTLAGAALTRYAILEAGKASAKSGADYLRYTHGPAPPLAGRRS